MKEGSLVHEFAEFQGRCALITGSSRGIGRSIALSLAKAGARVAVHCNLSVDEGAEVVRAIAGAGGVATLVTGDTRRRDDVERICRDAVDRLGEIDILVNNAAYALQKPFLDITVDEWVSQLHYKGLGYYLTSRNVLPTMVKRGKGVIVNLLSTTGVRGGEGEAGYAATNAAAMALTRAIANEFGPFGIRCCGVMLTWAENAFDPGSPDSERYLERFPLKRVTRLEEVAGTVLFLASDTAGGITGSFVCVDAGYLAKW